MPEKVSNDNVFMTYSIDAEGKVTGKTRRQSTDYNAMITRGNINNQKEEEYLENLKTQIIKSKSVNILKQMKKMFCSQS